MFLKQLPLAKFLDSLSIQSATSDTWNLVISQGFDTIDKILNLSVNEISLIGKSTNRTIGERATTIHKSLHNPKIIRILEQAKKHNLFKESESFQFKMDFKNKRVCLTGSAPHPREKIKEWLISAGAIVQSAVSSNTDYLLCESSSSTSGKAKKARELGTKVVGYSEIF